jgi:hypothetical protein
VMRIPELITGRMNKRGRISNSKDEGEDKEDILLDDS